MNQAITDVDGVPVPHEQGIRVSRAVTIALPTEELYAFWRSPTNLPGTIDTIESVQMIDDRRARWRLKLPAGMTIDLAVVVIHDVPGEAIGWRSLPESQVAHAGSVRFRPAPGDRGSEMHLTIEFVPPGGMIGQAVGNLFSGAPKVYLGQMLREIKQMLETGERATIQGQPSGREEHEEVQA